MTDVKKVAGLKIEIAAGSGLYGAGDGPLEAASLSTSRMHSVRSTGDGTMFVDQCASRLLWFVLPVDTRTV
jgi:hypothetical protein